mmetsp:Transcript_18220/g.28265  ORF Transcript_18220/g.28265 Transcript_18220/m.28265 type:complete len:115 (-) Transcript_18220:3149-3493(-)
MKGPSALEDRMMMAKTEEPSKGAWLPSPDLYPNDFLCNSSRFTFRSASNPKTAKHHPSNFWVPFPKQILPGATDPIGAKMPVREVMGRSDPYKQPHGVRLVGDCLRFRSVTPGI